MTSEVSNHLSTQHHHALYAGGIGLSFFVGAMLIYPLAVYVLNKSSIFQETLSAFLITSAVFIATLFLKNKGIITNSRLFTTIEVISLFFFVTMLTPQVTSWLHSNYHLNYTISALVHSTPYGLGAVIAALIRQSQEKEAKTP